MQKRLRTVLAVVLLAVLGAVAREGLRTREPEYQGKRLSQWMECFSVNRMGSLGADDLRLPRAALAQAGTNAIPVLLHMLQAEESLVSRTMSLLSRQHILKIRDFQPSDRNHAALIGFLYYRESASNAVPELIKMLDGSRSAICQENAARALTYIGPAAKSAIPALLRSATSTNNAVCRESIDALGNVRPEPELIVPVLVSALRRPDNTVQNMASTMLRSYGRDAASAVPSLIDLLKSQDQNTRFQAAFSLLVLDPNVAVKAGVDLDPKALGL
jgi:HEAT repeat protein